jgi:hypothetical protein
MSTGPAHRPVAGVALLSFEGPRADDLRLQPRRSLKTAQRPIMGIAPPLFPCGGAHRQDIKGVWRMPWHQESKKDVDGCDKPR